MIAKPAAAPPVYELATSGALYTITRNGKPLLSPKGHGFELPTERLAVAIIEEWRAQKPKIDPASMPLNQLAATAIDLITFDRAKKIEELLRYCESDQLCYRAERPDALIALQNQLWQPLLNWAAKHYQLQFVSGSGIMPVTQSPLVLARLRRIIETMDNFRLAGLRHTAASSCSLVIALAVQARHIDAEAAFEAAELDSCFQMQSWGKDPDTLKRQATVKIDLADCQRWFGLLA